MNSAFNYTVALSFASEDNEYVEQFATLLKNQGVATFHYKHEEVAAWGKPLSPHLIDIYRDKSRYVIIFFSKYYKEKIWTSHELKAALERASVQSDEYILPVSLDGSPIPNAISGVGYICLLNKPPEYLLSKIQEKLSVNQQLEKFSLPNNENDRRQLELLFSKIEFDIFYLYIQDAPKYISYRFRRAVDCFHPIIHSPAFYIQNEALRGKLWRFFNSWINLSESISPLNGCNSYDLLEPQNETLIYRSIRGSKEEYELLETNFSELGRYCSEFIQEVRRQHPEIDLFSLSNKARNLY